MNEQNLKPFGTWDAEEHRKVSAMGGKASGIARRRKAAILYLCNRAVMLNAIDDEMKRLEYNERKRVQRAANRAKKAQQAQEVQQAQEGKP